MKKVLITVQDKTYPFPSGTTVREVLKKTMTDAELPPLGAILYNRLVDPDYIITNDCSVSPVTYQDWIGVAIYRRSATHILIQAVHDLFSGKRLVIGQSIADGYYFDLYAGQALKPEDVKKIEERMRLIVREDRPFVKTYLPYVEAKHYFERLNLFDKVKLLDFLRSPEVPVVSCGDFFELYSGSAAPSTGQIQVFALEPYQEGFVLRFPAWIKGWKLAPMRHETKLFNVYRETRDWNKILSVENVGQLNELCVSGQIRELILIAEALHEKKIAAIADEIKRRSDDLKIVMIAGPSSSGKTTFAKRLRIELKVNGFDPIALSMDNYFKDRENTPRDKNGDYDFEALDALDLGLLNQQLQGLMQGKVVKTPVFDFRRGSRKEAAVTVQLTPGRILLVEGIHALNDRSSEAIPPDRKYKIYVSALTQLCVDDHNRILTSDSRLLRRIVRDRIYRDWNAAETISRWPSVRRGENRNIFPFQEGADIMFNSALIYEQAVLKNYAELALLEVTPDKPEYIEADRLLNFLSFFAPISEKDVPLTSLLREFIGGSFFEY